MKTIYVFGNPLVEEDSLPLRLLPKLRKEFPTVEFVEFDTTEDLEQKEELVIIDIVKGIRRAGVFGIDMMAAGRIYTMHDFDLGMTLKLWKKTGMIKDAKIIGIPCRADEDVLREICNLIRSICQLKSFNSEVKE